MSLWPPLPPNTVLSVKGLSGPSLRLRRAVLLVIVVSSDACPLLIYTLSEETPSHHKGVLPSPTEAEGDCSDLRILIPFLELWSTITMKYLHKPRPRGRGRQNRQARFRARIRRRDILWRLLDEVDSHGLMAIDNGSD